MWSPEVVVPEERPVHDVEQDEAGGEEPARDAVHQHRLLPPLLHQVTDFFLFLGMSVLHTPLVTTILTQCWYQLCPPARPPCWCRGWGQPRGRGAAWRAAAGTGGAGAGAGRAAGRGTRGCPAHGRYYHHTAARAVPGAAAPRRLPPRARCVWAGAGCRGRGAPRNFCNIGAALGGDHQLFTFI